MEGVEEDASITFKGWVFKDPETGDPIRYDDDCLAEAGAMVIRAAGVSYRPDNLQADAFRPGQPLSLILEAQNPHDPNAVAIWDARRDRQVGYVPRQMAAELASRLRKGERLQASCLAEFVRQTGERCGLRVLIAPPGFRLESDRLDELDEPD